MSLISILSKARSVDESNFNLTLHVKVPADLRMKDVDILRHKMEVYLKENNILYTTIQFEGNECDL